jgi:type III restriction enzyme
MQLKNFQENAITELKSTFYKLWKSGNKNIPLVFKSATGSGKTIMMAEFLRRISGEASFDPDKCFIWISKGELANQSKTKLEKYFSSGLPWTNCLDINDLNNKRIKKNEIFFVNWEKVVSKSKDNRKLRKDSEANTTFDDFINNTHFENREIVLIIDEAHLNLTTALAKEIIDIINPRISIHISATPKKEPKVSQIKNLQAGYVETRLTDVISDGLIKESIKIMPKEEIEVLDKNQDLDKLLLDLAINKQQELKQSYDNLGLKINPLILVQLPNDEKEKSATEGQNKLEFCKAYLKDKKIDEIEIAVWLSGKKENLENIVENNSMIKVVIFKQAIATGWDCPRAQVLVSFREMKNPVFKTQVFGRILRMPQAKHYENHILNHSYCYTSYEKQEIAITIKSDGENLEKFQSAKIKKGVENIVLSSMFLSRTDYNNLGGNFQKTFIEVANKHFNITNDLGIQGQKKLKNKGLDIDATTLKNQLIVDAEIEVFDDFIQNLNNANEMEHSAAYNDVRKMYDLLLYREISNQEDSAKFGNVARSYGTLKSAMNVWLKRFVQSNPPLYALVCNDLLKNDSSILKNVIEKALKKYKPLRDLEVQKKSSKRKQNLTFSILPEYFYNENYQQINVKKYVLDDCYISYDSSIEETFIHFLEQQKIDWWYKNGSNSREAFAIEYTNNKGILSLFYPDFIIKQKNKVFIIDTKGGFTVDTSKEKSEALYNYCKENNGVGVSGVLSTNKINFKGGDLYLISGVVQLAKNGVWKINSGENYNNNIDEWDNFQEFF